MAKRKGPRGADTSTNMWPVVRDSVEARKNVRDAVFQEYEPWNPPVHSHLVQSGLKDSAQGGGSLSMTFLSRRNGRRHDAGDKSPASCVVLTYTILSLGDGDRDAQLAPHSALVQARERGDRFPPTLVVRAGRDAKPLNDSIDAFVAAPWRRTVRCRSSTTRPATMASRF